MTDLISIDEMIALHAAIKTNGNDAHADILAQMYSINCEMIDNDDIMPAAEDLVDAAGIARDIADAAVKTQQQDAIDAAADDEYSTRRADEL